MVAKVEIKFSFIAPFISILLFLKNIQSMIRIKTINTEYLSIQNGGNYENLNYNYINNIYCRDST